MTKNSSQSSPTKIKVKTEDEKANTVEEINVYEFSYSSDNPMHYWKKREVALILLGQFAEDIQ